MTLTTEFRPVSHEFFSDSSSGAAYIGASTADALWFYRYDSSFIEVRDVFSCQDKVFASLSTVEIKQRFKDVFRGNEVLRHPPLQLSIVLFAHDLDAFQQDGLPRLLS
jgi:hypothetical protein